MKNSITLSPEQTLNPVDIAPQEAVPSSEMPETGNIDNQTSETQTMEPSTPTELETPTVEPTTPNITVQVMPPCSCGQESKTQTMTIATDPDTGAIVIENALDIIETLQEEPTLVEDIVSDTADVIATTAAIATGVKPVTHIGSLVSMVAGLLTKIIALFKKMI